jgi:putative intracellular protease/amidase
VLVPIGHGTEEMEAVVIVDILRRSGAQVVVASIEQGLQVEASRRVNLVADEPIDSCDTRDFDLIALPVCPSIAAEAIPSGNADQVRNKHIAGNVYTKQSRILLRAQGGLPGSSRLRDSALLRRVTLRHAEQGKLVAAICAAPAVVLHEWGLLKGRKVEKEKRKRKKSLLLIMLPSQAFCFLHIFPSFVNWIWFFLCVQDATEKSGSSFCSFLNTYFLCCIPFTFMCQVSFYLYVDSIMGSPVFFFYVFGVQVEKDGSSF